MMTRLTTLCAVSAALGCALPAAAEEADPLPALHVIGSRVDSKDGNTGPSTVHLIDGAAAEERGIDSMWRAMEWIPNVSVQQADGERATGFSVRGAGELSFNELTGGRGGVGYYLDDVPCSDVFGRDMGLLDIDIIEFYKGPHGTAFGVPHSMGVFRAETVAPDATPRALAAAAYGTDGWFQLRAHASGQVANGLYLGIDGLHSGADGWFADDLTDDPYGAKELSSGRMRLRWVPDDHLEFSIIAGVSRFDDDPVVYVRPGADDPYQISTRPGGYSEGGNHYQSLQGQWTGETWRFKSITSHRHSDFDDDDPAFFLNAFPIPPVPRTRDQDVTDWSQEFRFESTDPDAVTRWRAGAFLGFRESELDHFILGIGPWEGGNRMRFHQDDFAIFGELTRRISERLELSGGLRIQSTHDRTRSTFAPTALAESLGGVPLATDETETFNAVLPMVAARWQWSEEGQSFVRFSTGEQPGGLAIAAAGSVDYDAQSGYHFEIGHDQSFADGKWRTHAAVFYSDYRDYQTFQFVPVGTTIFTADRASAWGAELQAAYSPADGIELHMGTGFTRAKFDDFVSPAGDFSGNRIDGIPEVTLNLGASCRANWGGLASLDWRLVGKTWYDAANTIHQGSYSILDARIGYERENLGIYLFARNLLDETYYTNIYLFQGAPTANLGTPRLVGMELKFTY